MELTVTAKIQVIADMVDIANLDSTMSVYRDACNYVSKHVFNTHNLKQFDLQDKTYTTLRSKYGL